MIRRLACVLAWCGLVALAAPVSASPRSSAMPAAPVRWTWRTVTVAKVPIRYAVVLPGTFAKGQRRNVLVAFPPGGQTADLVDVGMRAYWATEAARRGWVVISPAAPKTGLFFSGRSAALVEGFRVAALKDLGVVPGDVALGGISNGGLSAFRAAIDHPQDYVALVTLPGMPPEGNDANQVVKLRALRIGLWVGGNDTSWRSGSEFVQRTLAGLSSSKVAVQLHVMAGQGHIMNGIDPAAVWAVIDGS